MDVSVPSYLAYPREGSLLYDHNPSSTCPSNLGRGQQAPRPGANPLHGRAPSQVHAHRQALTTEIILVHHDTSYITGTRE